MFYAVAHLPIGNGCQLRKDLYCIKPASFQTLVQNNMPAWCRLTYCVHVKSQKSSLHLYPGVIRETNCFHVYIATFINISEVSAPAPIPPPTVWNNLCVMSFLLKAIGTFYAFPPYILTMTCCLCDTFRGMCDTKQMLIGLKTIVIFMLVDFFNLFLQHLTC